ncbi:MAG: YybH family protein [Steroidobacteraceae bacterium]
MRVVVLGLLVIGAGVVADPAADPARAVRSAQAASEGPAAGNAPVPAANPLLAAGHVRADIGWARVAAATVAPGAELAAFKKAIRLKYALKERAFANHDADTIVRQFYTPDVISVGQGEGIYVGTEQIRPLYEEVVKANKVSIDSIYTFVKGDAGWDWADFHVYPTDGKTAPFTFAILFLWTRIDGEWMCKGDFFVTGSLKEGKLTAPPAQAPPK